MESCTRITSMFVCGVLLFAVLFVLYIVSYPVFVRVRYATWSSHTDFTPAPFYRPIHWSLDHSVWASSGIRRACACLGAGTAFNRERHWYGTGSLESTDTVAPLLSESSREIQRRLKDAD